MIGQAHTTSHVGSAVGVAVIGATWLGYLPYAAAGFAILWYVVDLIPRVVPWIVKVWKRVHTTKPAPPPSNP